MIDRRITRGSPCQPIEDYHSVLALFSCSLHSDDLGEKPCPGLPQNHQTGQLDFRHWAIATAVGAIATAIATYFLLQQLTSATNSLYIGNSYTVQKDIAEGYDRISNAQDQIIYQDDDRSHAKALASVLKRQVIGFDTLFEAVHGLRNNGGLSTETWQSILQRNCPIFGPQYNLGGTSTPAIKDACEGGKMLWRKEVK